MQNYTCPHCGGELFWNPEKGCLECQYCGNQYQPSDFEDKTTQEQPAQTEEIDPTYTAAVETETYIETPQTDTSDMVVYSCKNCGGEIITLKTTMATICPYCGEAISITSKSAGDFRPRYCIPFKNKKKDVIKMMKKYTKQSCLVPKKFKQEAVIEKIQGIYVPFYLHSMGDDAYHRFNGEKTSSYRRGDDKVVVHKNYDLEVYSYGEYRGVPTDGAKRIKDELMQALEPFDYHELKEYNPAYMAGFAAEMVDEDEESMYIRAESRVKSDMQEKARSVFSAYELKQETDMNHEIKNHVHDYVMLPVWLLNIKYKDQLYTYAVNGQNGKVVGNLPISKVKQIGTSVGTFIGTYLVVAIIISFL